MTAQALAGGVSVYNAVPKTVITFLLSGTPISEDSDPGKLVKLHTANNTVAFCADGDDIFGRIESVEDRVVEGIVSAGIMIAGGMKIDFVDSDAVAIGEKVVAGGVDSVKRVASPSAFNRTQVVAKNGTTTGTVEVLLFGFGGGTA